MKIMKKSRRPFKSGKQIETVIFEGINPKTGKEAYVLVDCVVDKRTCVVLENG
jgi:hypothetical protein